MFSLENIPKSSNSKPKKAKSSTAVETAPKEKEISKNNKRRKTSDSTQNLSEPGPSNTQPKSEPKKNISEGKLKKNKQKKLDKATAAFRIRTGSASDSALAEVSTNTTNNSRKKSLQKTKSDSSVVESTNKGRKRKAKAATPAFSPKKLRSSSTSSTITSATASSKKDTKRKKTTAKTGARSSRERNPPEVDEPAGDSSDKLGSCASRRYVHYFIDLHYLVYHIFVCSKAD